MPPRFAWYGADIWIPEELRLVPALQGARRDVNEPLRDSGKGVSGGFRGRWLRDALVVMEVALSLTLLMGAGPPMLAASIQVVCGGTPGPVHVPSCSVRSVHPSDSSLGLSPQSVNPVFQVSAFMSRLPHAWRKWAA
jgi:hypothetical protein